MILDNEAVLKTATAFNLETVRPGPGRPITMFATGVGASLVITTGATSAAAGACITVDATSDVTFTLPTSVKQYIKCTFAAGTVAIAIPQTQTNL